MASPLSPLPPGFGPTVASLHRVAEEIVAPARKPDNEIALQPTPGGFGTPEFEFEGTRRQVRVEGAELGYAKLSAAPDPLAVALDFFQTRRRALAPAAT